MGSPGTDEISQFLYRELRMLRVFDRVEPGEDSRVAPLSVLPSASINSVGAPDRIISRLNAGLRSPLSTLRRRPHGRRRMTRGQGGSLFLSCIELSSTTLCQSPGALIVLSCIDTVAQRSRFKSMAYETPSVASDVPAVQKDTLASFSGASREHSAAPPRSASPSRCRAVLSAAGSPRCPRSGRGQAARC